MILPILKSIRFVNLLMLAASQALAYYAVYLPFWDQATGLPASLNPKSFWLALSASILVMSFGNLQNDWLDRIADEGYGKKNFFNTVSNPAIGVALMVIMPLLALGISLYLQFEGLLANYWMIVLGAIVGLAAYNLWYKSIPLIGNLIVAALSAFGALLPLFIVSLLPSDTRLTVQEGMAKSDILHLALVFGGFCFLASLTREVIKDFEDMDRDRAAGIQTLATESSLLLVRSFVSIPLILCLATGSALLFRFMDMLNTIEIGGWILVLIVNVLLLIMMLRMDNPAKAKAVSRMLKVFLILGLSTLAWLPLPEMLFHGF